MVDLLVLNGSRAGDRLALREVPAVLGRSPEAHLRIDDPWVSNMHALFEARGAALWVVDLGSRNGTYVDGERVEERAVGPGSVLAFGRTEVRLEPRDGGAVEDEPARTPLHLEVFRTTIRTDRPGEAAAAREAAGEEADPFRFTPRTLVLLRLSLTVLPDQPAPEGAALRQALEAALDAVRAEGGRAAPLGGGGLAASFGFGTEAADDAARALRAAAAARRALRSAPGVAVRMAVDAGPAMAGVFAGPGGSELLALGETPDRLERLVAAARPGEILVGPGVPASASSLLEPVPDGRRAPLTGLRRVPD